MYGACTWLVLLSLLGIFIHVCVVPGSMYNRMNVLKHTLALLICCFLHRCRRHLCRSEHLYHMGTYRELHTFSVFNSNHVHQHFTGIP